MTNPVVNPNVNLFVTHIEVKESLLRIYAQTDKELSCRVERILNSLTRQFDEGLGRPVPDESIKLGSRGIFCALFEKAYYRAKIQSVHSPGNILVQFIDYGNIELVHPHDIRILDGIAGAAELLEIPPLAEKFIIAGILPKHDIWNDQNLRNIIHKIRYNDCPAKIIVNHPSFQLIEMFFNGQNFAHTLIKQNMAIEVSIEDQLRVRPYVQPPHLQPPHLQQPLIHQSQMHMQKPLVQIPLLQHVAQPNPRVMNNYGVPRDHTSLRLPRTQHYQESWRGQGQQGPPNVSPGITIPLPRIPSHHQDADPGVFRSRILEVGAQYEVTVPYVEDGPLMFSVQDCNTEEELKSLMNRMNKAHKPEPLVEPPVIGTVCLGRYSNTKTLLRAVVGQVREHGCKIHYIDYGYVEILPFTDMYQLPREFIKPRALSIRFTMSNINEVNITDETKKFFKNYVAGKKLRLHVRPPETSSLIQCCDLYDNECNIKELLRSRFGDSITKWPSSCKLMQGSREIVQVVCVDGAIVYVQLDTDAPTFLSMTSELAEYVVTAPPMKPSQLKKGLACIALSSADFTWYRAEILNVSGDNVTVSYVDYGNQEIIPAGSIRSIRDKNTKITKLRAQGIRCILNNYHEITTQELSTSLESEIMGKLVAMIVTKVGSDGPIVDLFDSKMDPLVNIIQRLKRTSVVNGNVEKRADSHNDKNRNFPNSNANRRSSVKKQPNVGQQQKSKSQNVKAAREDQTNKWNNSPRSDNPRVTETINSTDRGRTNNWKEEENEQRRFDNRYQNRGNDKEWQSNAGGQRQQNDRFSRNDGRNDRGTRDEPKHERYDRFANDSNANGRQTGRDNRDNRGGRGGFSNPRFGGNNVRSERQGSADKSWSDKDSDTSSRGSGRNGRRGSNGGGGRTRRDGDGDRGGYKNGQRINTAAARIARDKPDFGNSNETKQQFGNWPITDEKTPTSNIKNVVIPPPNISVGAVKNCEIVFIKDPTDFHVQLSPDNLELHNIMARIATSYEENGGKILATAEIKSGMSCVAQYSEDSIWYRATVKSVEGSSGATVNFVDYGNVEFVEFGKIKELEAEYAKVPSQAINCKLLAAGKSTWESTEIEKFSLLTDGKLFEAEFISQENNIYEILLREIVDDAPAMNYINEEFSDGADLTEAKNNARNKGRPGQIVVQTDYVPIDYKWTVVEPTVGSKQNVIVPWFTNPENFYCQMLASKDQFRQMMLDIQKIDASRQPVGLPLQIGSAVIAVFSEDGAFYRAEILELNKERGNIVRYVDFGNTAMVEPRNIYRVERRFTEMPKQAFNCSLKNLVPANGSNWSKANRQELEKCFEVDDFECTIHEIKETGKCVISLSHEGTDVAGLLVEKSLASFAVSAGSVEAEKNEVDETKQPSEAEPLPRFDISLLAGQVLRVKVSNVASAEKFHIQLPSAEASEKLINAYMAQNDPKVMPRLSCHEVCLGAGCLVNTDEGWRRAVVINCSRTTGFDVRLIDTGANDEIPLDCMLGLPGELSVMQNQAVECCLKNATTSIVLDEKLRDMIENTDVIIAIDEVDNNRLIVKLYDVDGNRIKLSDDEKDEKICPVCPMPILYSSQKVAVSHAEHSGSVWLKRTADVDLDGELHGKMFDHYNTSTGPAPIALPDALCAAKSSDENWYRAKVVRTSQFGVIVHFIDYGNNEDVPFESLRILEKEFTTQSQLAIEVALTVSLDGSIEQQQDILKEHIVDEEFIATIYNVRKKWVAELTNEEGKMSEKLSSLEAVQVLKNRDVQGEIKEMIVGERYEVTCPHADSPARFWLQRNEELSAIEQLQEKVQIEATSAPILKGIPEIGTHCLALYSVDKQWYRAVVLDADEDITSIRFIDFGNTDVVDTNMGKSKEISDSLKSIKSYAIKCRLDVIPYGGEDWMTAACEWFEAIITSVEHIEALVIADTEPRRVELFVGETSMVDDLVKRNYATKIHTEEDLIEEIVEREVDLRAAYVSHAISPSEFWIQQEKYVGDLEILADRFLVADMFPELNNIEEGMLCVAKFPEDESWYRARVISHADTGTEVIYVDYGNSAISTEIREIPADAAEQPAFSKKCRLILPEGVEQWSEEACVEFVKMAADGATIFQLEMIDEREDTSIVRLTQDGKDIVDSLTKLCSPHVPIIEERLPPLGEENSPNVLVSHVNSPSDFSTQAESAINELEIMSDHLATAESFLPLDCVEEGMICAAKFPEDDQWYRAKILSHGDAGTEVHYIDYGNSAITTELRVLPEDIVKKPALSTCCSLRMPDNVESWSKEACEKFFELVDDGITMFQYEILNDKEETTLIRLCIDGKDIVEILAPLCTKNPRENDLSTDETTSSEQIESHDVHEIVENIVDRVNLDSLEQTSSTETSGVEVVTTSDNSTLGSFTKHETSTEFTTIQISESKNLASDEIVASPENIRSFENEIEVITEITEIVPEVDIITESLKINENNVEEITKIDENNVEESRKIDENKVKEITKIDENKVKEIVEITPNENRLEEVHLEGETQEAATIVVEEQSIRPKTPITEKILPGSVARGLSEQDIILCQIVRRNSVPLEDKIVPGSINKGESLTVQDSTNETLQDSTNETLQLSTNENSIQQPFTTEEHVSPVITKKLSFCEKILPGSISTGDSPVAELKCPTTPKTPLSEKLVAGVVNLQEKLADFEKDEVMMIVTDENIPK